MRFNLNSSLVLLVQNTSIDPCIGFTVCYGNRLIRYYFGCLPGGTEQRHPTDALDRHQKIHGTENRPPTRARPLHPPKTLQFVGSLFLSAVMSTGFRLHLSSGGIFPVVSA